MRCALLGTFLAASLASGAEEPAKAYGSAFLDAWFPPGGEVRDAVKLRYHCHVDVNECDTPEKWKILFMFHFLHGPGNPGTYEVQSNLYTWRFAYPHPSRRLAGGAVEGLRHLPGESGLFLSVPDNHKNRRVGALSRSPAMFPTLDQEIDGFKDLWKREQVSQMNLTGKTLTVEIARGTLLADTKGWSVHGSLPEGKYRIWTATAAWEGGSHQVDFALPEESAQYFAPSRMTQIATEAFAIHPGRIKALYWGMEIQREHRTDWMPLQTWKLTATDASPTGNTWGMKRAEVEGKPAIEASNDGTPTYARKGDVLELK